MRFSTIADSAPTRGMLRYEDQDHAFSFQVDTSTELEALIGRSGTAVIEIGTLQLEVGIETGIVLFAWGYHPRTHWQVASLSAPIAVRRSLLAHTEGHELEQGVGVKLVKDGQWTTTIDRHSGWIRVAPDPCRVSDSYVEFASGCVVGLEGQQLQSLWLHPA